MSIFVLNIATMLGLALAIDYSLFIVSRFREELRRGRTVADAVERTVATAGKAVAFSGIAVAIGLSGPARVRGAGASGRSASAASIVVLCSVLYALTFLPAVLGMLGHRVNALSLRRPVASLPAASPPIRWPRRRGHHAGSASPTPSCAVRSRSSSRRSRSCSSPARPFLRLEQGVPGAEIYPAGVESRDAYVALQTEFAPGETTPIVDPRRRRRRANRRRRRTSRPSRRLASAVDAHRWHRSGGGTVRHPRPARPARS